MTPSEHARRKQLLLDRFLEGQIDKPAYDEMLAELGRLAAEPRQRTANRTKWTVWQRFPAILRRPSGPGRCWAGSAWNRSSAAAAWARSGRPGTPRRNVPSS